jgi:hypothetical protein
MGKRTQRRLHVALAAGACLLLVRATAGAAPTEVTPTTFVGLQYDVDPSLPGCLGLPEFRALVATQLGYDPFRGDASVGVVVRAWQGEKGIEGRLDWQTAADEPLGQRHFSSPGQTCREVIPALGFALVVQIQMLANQVKPAAPAEKPAVDQPREMPSTPPAPTSPPDLRWSYSGGLGAAAAIGLANQRLGLGRLFVAASRGWLQLELGGEACLSATTRLDGGGDFHHRFVLGAGAVCWQRPGLVPCAIGKLGLLRVQGENVDKPASPQGFVAQAGARLGWPVLLGDHLGVRVWGEGLYLVSPWTVRLNHVDVWTMPHMSASLGIDIFLRGE